MASSCPYEDADVDGDFDADADEFDEMFADMDYDEDVDLDETAEYDYVPPTPRRIRPVPQGHYYSPEPEPEYARQPYDTPQTQCRRQIQAKSRGRRIDMNVPENAPPMPRAQQWYQRTYGVAPQASLVTQPDREQEMAIRRQQFEERSAAIAGTVPAYQQRCGGQPCVRNRQISNRIQQLAQAFSQYSTPPRHICPQAQYEQMARSQRALQDPNNMNLRRNRNELSRRQLFADE